MKFVQGSHSIAMFAAHTLRKSGVCIILANNLNDLYRIVSKGAVNI